MQTDSRIIKLADCKSDVYCPWLSNSSALQATKLQKVQGFAQQHKINTCASVYVFCSGSAHVS